MQNQKWFCHDGFNYLQSNRSVLRFTKTDVGFYFRQMFLLINSVNSISDFTRWSGLQLGFSSKFLGTSLPRRDLVFLSLTSRNRVAVVRPFLQIIETVDVVGTTGHERLGQLSCPPKKQTKTKTMVKPSVRYGWVFNVTTTSISQKSEKTKQNERRFLCI